jgi:hypothetical protein
MAQIPVPENVLNDVLEQRGKIYGSFTSHASITQMLENLCEEHFNNVHTTHNFKHFLTPVQLEGLHMILHKIGRIVNGDPMYEDSWRDIAGYATLVADGLKNEQNVKSLHKI